MKKVIEGIQKDWDSFECKAKYRIVQRRAEIGRHVTVIVIPVFCTAVIFYTSFPILTPILLDVVAPLEESRPLQPTLMEYFVDQQTYFYPILLHTFVVISISCMIVVATDTSFIMYMQHIFGMLELARATTESHFDETFITAVFLLLHYAYCFYINYLGQKMIDSSTEIFKTTYDTHWYMAPVTIQKSLILIIQRSMESVKLLVGNIFVASFEGFILYNMDLLMQTLLYMIPFMLYALKYNTFRIDVEKIKDLMEQVKRDWNSLKRTEEIKILRRHAYIAWFATVGCSRKKEFSTLKDRHVFFSKV
ncbi:hypothetical protein KM043_002455 [Ampulex compressa]|nr:hypothetical protein KM043_002455 [Ampulex compressa]